jgi:predicted nucleotidyltransferase
MEDTTRIEATLQEIVRRLVDEYAPRRIVLFGSYATGHPDPDSDLDLLIVKETDERWLDRQTTVRRVTAGAHPGLPFDPLVLTPTEIEQRLRVGDQFIAEILDTGRVLHAAERIPLSGAIN